MPSSIFADRYGAMVAVLRQARRDAGVTQVQLAEKLMRPQSYVSKVERHERRVDPVEFYDWAVALELDPIELFAKLARTLASR